MVSASSVNVPPLEYSADPALMEELSKKMVVILVANPGFKIPQDFRQMTDSMSGGNYCAIRKRVLDMKVIYTCAKQFPCFGNILPALDEIRRIENAVKGGNGIQNVGASFRAVSVDSFFIFMACTIRTVTRYMPSSRK